MEQIIGRILRSDNPIMYYLIDNNPISKKHYNETLPLFKELNAEIETVNMKPGNNSLKSIQKQSDFNCKVNITKINAILNMSGNNL